ncbi:hypothetical protein MMC26_002975 [Xylographa opegraphella]|nr:hypothetical protein [Xylographa opegraphella]
MECIWDGKRMVLDTECTNDLPDDLADKLLHGTNSEYLHAISLLALSPRWTGVIYHSHRPLFMDLCSRWMSCRDKRFDTLDAVSALTRILPVAPFLSRHVQKLVLQGGVEIFSVLRTGNALGLSQVSDAKLVALLNIVNRLLEFDNHTFANIISPVQMQVLLYHSQLYIRYLATSALCSYLRSADAIFQEMINKFVGQDIIEGPWEDRNIDYRFLRLWENKRVRDLQNSLSYPADMHHMSTHQPGHSRVIRNEDLSPLCLSFAGALVPSVDAILHYESSFVLTDTTRQNLRAIANGVLDPRPLLITGLPGSGKTSVIREISQTLGKASSMLTLHLNEQTDAKLLIGMYTSATSTGSFTWRPGVLTTAVQEGRWVLVEDLDRAPADILSTFLPLLERGELLVPNLGGSIRAAPGFKVIATVRSSLNIRSEEVAPGTSMLGNRFWNRVTLRMLSSQDLSEIILARFPVLRLYELGIIRLYQRLTSARSRMPTGFISSQSHGKLIGPQELLRYCARLENVLRISGVKTGDEAISETTADNMFMEAVDCFAGSMPSGSLRDHTLDQISQELHVSPERAHYCVETRIPEYSNLELSLSVGRIKLQKRRSARSAGLSRSSKVGRPFAITNHAMRHLESIAAAVATNEPCLLVGETGTGKTTLIQELSRTLGHELVVVNLSQQSESGDLLGGYKPLNLRVYAMPIQEEFEDLFDRTFSSEKNQRFIKSVARTVARGEWVRTVALWYEALKMVEATFKSIPETGADDFGNKPKKRRKIESPKFQKLKTRWTSFGSRVDVFGQQIEKGSKGFSFFFVEGNIIKAVRSGAWVLLDEINLASPDTLESLADLLSDKSTASPSILLSETGDVERIQAHPDFRIFGAMNPATDVGKRALPTALRGRFTEYYVDSPENDLESLKQIINTYLGNYVHSDIEVAQDVAQLYLETRRLENENRLVDGADQKPHYSLRTLTRTLTYVIDIAPLYGLRRALFEGFSMSFLTVLNKESEMLIVPLINDHLLGAQKNRRALLNQTPRCPTNGKRYVQFRHYWVAQGNCAIEEQPQYIITPFVESNLLNLVRATSTRRFPVLLQGPTSSGKTSMVEYLAKLSGNKFVRINNHEHTDLQEYIGTYVSNSEGRLQYQEGILVQALREGHWIVLDELNLAPTDVLEALNRLLDDNRELFVPETQQIVRPHENFMLFATQNPPGLYGGRKILSRAFRNRFLELHFDDIPENELETILRERTQIAPSFCTRIVIVYKRLSVLRQSGRLFEQKQSFATLRDLFRWALRDADTREQLAINGYLLLAERVRDTKERLIVKQVIEEVMKVKIDDENIYNKARIGTLESSDVGIVWTQSMRRLYMLITQALTNNEPVLLIGPTGCGKTSICQAIADSMQKRIHILNAHQNTETGDLIGAQRPIRNRPSLEGQVVSDIKSLFTNYNGPVPSSSDSFPTYVEFYNSLSTEVRDQIPTELRLRIQEGIAKAKQLFEWSDGSLVSAMKAGHHFLLDEIALADDSVLERLNSVLEPSRTLLLAEKGPQGALVKASAGFHFLATMNPGGDYGKRELSPALRNRFTEIWVPALSASSDVLQIVEAKLLPSLKRFGRPMVEFSAWFGITYDEMAALASLRQILAWVCFINESDIPDIFTSILHGAAMVYIDGLGANPAAQLSITQQSIANERSDCIRKLTELFGHDMSSLYDEKLSLVRSEVSLMVGHFTINRIQGTSLESDFSFEAPTTLSNTMRIIRALHLKKPLLIEGSPGVGKTTLISALARVTGMLLTRINLSEQTDIMDLFGSDVPTEGQSAGKFTWREAPFLQAMQKGQWVLLDEMNLASQSVLEGLNACLDHRGQVYIPELDQTFSRHPDFVLFAAQNPHRQGGGRKGLPASFVNRFTVVYADLFTPTDLLSICNQLYPNISSTKTMAMVKYVSEISSLTQKPQTVAVAGAPWEFNLRDVLRWLHLLDSQERLMPAGHISDYESFLFLQRFRSRADSITIGQRVSPLITDKNNPYRNHFQNVGPLFYQCGLALLSRNFKSRLQQSWSCLQDISILESVMLCVQQSWPCLLVGPSGSGKTSLIQHVSGMTGADVVELSLNSDMDTMDLVGGYEQIDIQRKISSFLERLRNVIKDALATQLLDSVDISVLSEMIQMETNDLGLILQLLNKSKDAIGTATTTELAEECRFLIERSSVDNRARFEWMDGILVKALESGQWLVLDNANLCSSSVLDRLNSLLEPGGSLAVHEHHLHDGCAKIVRPHPNFRLFLTMDPRYGELSRAMRNRCIEIFLCTEDPQGSQVNLSTLMCDSKMFRYNVFDSFDWNSLENASVRALAFVCAFHLTPFDISICDSWLHQAKGGLISIQPNKLEIVKSAFHVGLRLSSQKTAVCAAITQLYEGLLAGDSFPVDFAHIQVSRQISGRDIRLLEGLADSFYVHKTIHPLNNSHLLSLRPQIYPRLMYLASLLETLVDLETFKVDLSTVESSLHKKSASELSRLERSMASIRILAFSKDQTQPVANFLSHTRLCLADWVEEQASNVTNNEASNFLCEKDFYNANSHQTDIGFLKEFVCYIRDVFDVTQYSKLDDGSFTTYLTIGNEIVAHAVERKTAHRLTSTIKKLLDVFKASWELSSGYGMENLWRMFAPPTATSERELNLVVRFENVAGHFDSIVWQSKLPLDTLAELRGSMIQLKPLEQQGDKHVEQSLKAIEEAMGSAENSLALSIAPTHPYFYTEFEGLRQYHALSQSQTSPESSYKLDLLSCRPCRYSIYFGDPSPGSRALAQIHDLIGNPSNESGLIPLRNVLPISMLGKLIKINEVPLKSLDLLCQEIKLLAQSTAQSCHTVSKNQYHKLNSCLAQIMEKFVDAHTTSLEGQSLSAYHEFLTAIQENPMTSLQKPVIGIPKGAPKSGSDVQMQLIFDTYIIPSISALREAASQEVHLISTARAWILFFTGVLRAYIPDRPFDPAMKSMIESDRFKKRRTELQTRLDALIMFETISTGENSSPRCEAVRQELQALGGQPEASTILRPAITELPQLQGEFTNLLSSIIRKSPSIEDLKTLVKRDSASIRELNLLRKNIAQVIHRLSENFRSYDDITKPVIWMLEGLDIGLSLALMVTKKHEEGDNLVQRISECIPFLGLRPCYINRVLDYVETERIQDTLRMSRLKLGSIRRQVLGRNQHEVCRSTLGSFQSYYEDWKRRLTKEQNKYSSKVSLYRYRGADEENEDANDEEFATLFPSYDLSQRETIANDGAKPNDEQVLAQRLAEVHQDFFTSNSSTVSQMLAMVSRATSDMVASWKDTGSTSIFPITPEEMLPGLIVSLHKTSEELLQPTPSGPGYNFYVDANLPEVRRLIALLGRIRERFKSIQDQWPEHATLEDVLRTCESLLEFRHVEPIAKIITKCEQLYTFIHEWQVVASREFSATALYNEFTDLLISWRRLELSTWAGLLDMEDTNCIKDAKGWWFLAYESIIAASLTSASSGGNISEHSQQLIATLENFMRETSVGQYSERIQLIETFRDHIGMLAIELPSLGVVRNSLTNFLSFYIRFRALIHENILNGRKVFEKDMKEIILLASWKDTNITALRESAKRSHHKLFKVIRKHRALLSQPADVIIKQGIPASSMKSIVHHNSFDWEPLNVDPAAVETCRQCLPQWDQKPSRLVKPMDTVLIMGRLAAEPTSIFDYSLYIDSFSTNLTDTIKILQKETPSQLNTENKDLVKHLKSRKRKVFADTLKEIRDMGFNSNPGLDILANQISLPVILSSTSALQSREFPNEIGRAEYYFHKTLENIIEVRKSARQHSEDLGPSETSRSVGYLESITSVLLRQRASLAPSLSQLQGFQRTIEKIQSLWAPSRYSLQMQKSPGTQLILSLECCIKWLPAIIEVGVIIVKRHNSLSGIDTVTVLTTLSLWKEKYTVLASRFDRLPSLPPGVSSSLHAGLLQDSETAIDEFSREMHTLKSQAPLIGFAIDQILIWTNTDGLAEHKTTNGVYSASLANIDQAVSTLVDTILVGVQHLQETLTTLPNSYEARAWVLLADSSRDRGLKFLHITELTTKIDHALSQLQYLSQTDLQDLRGATALFHIALPIMKQYGAIYSNILRRHLEFHASLCRMACILSASFRQILVQGFCSPVEKSAAEEGRTEKLEAGTGLGEGEGAEDISKDIKDDEDLSELAQESRKDKGEEEIEDEKDAVNMDQDELEGEMGEPGENEEEDGSDAESEASEGEIDEEAGEVDDLDPSALDEKLWDGSGENAEREKEGDQSKGRKENEIAAQDSALGQDDAEDEEGEDIDETGADEGEDVRQEDVEKTDPHLQEGQKLDLPDEMDLGEEAQSITDSDDEGMRDLSDVEQDRLSEKDEEDDQSGSKEAELSDVDMENDQSQQEDFDDAQKTEEAASPVDTEPEDEGEVDDQGLLRDRAEKEAVDVENVAPSDVQGIGESGDSQNDAKSQPENTASSDRPADSSTALNDNSQAEAEEGESGPAEGTTGTNDAPQNSAQDGGEVEAFRKLGDALEKWHRQSKRINQSSANDKRNQPIPTEVDGAEQDFEHLPDEDAEADTQALGAATEDQALALDKRALDAEMQDQPADFLPDEAPVEDLDEDQAMDDVNSAFPDSPDLDQSLRSSATIGAKANQQDPRIQEHYNEAQNEQDIENLDNDLSTVHLTSQAGTLSRSPDEARRLWSHYEGLTRDLAFTLTEQLRLILAPTLATKMRGDFRTGKRLNIKRIIPYIASQYKRDKIWMRRSVPSKRNYQIMLAVDDSSSMGESGSGPLAFETLALVSKSLSMLEVGQISIVGFGNDVHVAHEFDQTFSSEAGVQTFQQFTFQQTNTNVRRLIARSIELFRDARIKSANSGADLWQLELIISDGVCEDHESIKRLVRQAQEERIMIVFVIVDSMKGESIMDMTQATFEPDEGGETSLKIKRYLDDFPFGCYLIVGNVKELPGVLATALRQWFAEVMESE